MANTADLRDLNQIPGFDNKPSIDPESADALDALFKQKTGEAPPTEGDVQAEIKVAPKPEEKKEEPKVEEAPPADDKEEKEVKEVKKEEKPVEEKKDEKKVEAQEEKSGDELDKVTLPPYTTKKSAESFDKVKAIARERITAAEKERDELKKQVAELAARTPTGVPPETEAELKELREFRAKVDVEVLPEFKTYDTQIASNVQSIYDRLTAAGHGATIEQIKKLGGPDQVDWEAVGDKIPVALKRFIENKLGENEGLLDKKSKAIETAKTNATEYLKTREAEVNNARTLATKNTDHQISELVPKLGWLEERKAKADATEADKVLIAQHNQLVADSKAFLEQVKSDDSPEMRGILAVGYVQLQKARADYEFLKGKTDAQIKELQAQVKEANEKLDKIKKASTSRLRDNGSETGGEVKPPKIDVNTSGAEHLDNLYKATLAAK